ncbi:hypothetical protein CBR_g6535 [Chara braunii]|uniref:J domain-containing protein n=1 Tax=Chara braunii TaxID=69332 RepID=A0A388KK50_CHABU|nr:hypothetical protein CBR_g6535 [Chara braunii]|eukprot:GBG70407.1 hypothetical protein CBR_g6535 [Chara braunii]
MFFFFGVSLAIYCDDEDCYEVLKVKQTATPAEIKKAYYKLSLQYHPDKNKDPDAQKIFAKIATAYEILWNEKTRADYDYFLAHPDEVFYNTMQYYRRYVGHQADVRAVAIGFLLVLSAVQYAAAWGHYRSVIEAAKQTPAYRNKLKALEWERRGGLVSRKKGGKGGRSKGVTSEEMENLEAEVEVEVHGAEKPTIWGLVGMRVLLLPYVIGRLLLWETRWIMQYGIKKYPYSWNDAAYLTRRSLGYSEDIWWAIGQSRRERLMDHQIWIPANRIAFENAQRESRRRH